MTDTETEFKRTVNGRETMKKCVQLTFYFVQQKRRNESFIKDESFHWRNHNWIFNFEIPTTACKPKWLTKGVILTHRIERPSITAYLAQNKHSLQFIFSARLCSTSFHIVFRSIGDHWILPLPVKRDHDQLHIRKGKRLGHVQVVEVWCMDGYLKKFIESICSF